MSKEKLAFIYYFAGFAALLAAVLWAFVGNNAGLAVLWLAVSALNLCMGGVWKNKAEEEKENGSI